MVKRILSIGIITIIGMTSLVASCLHHQKSTKPYMVYQESRQYEKEVYYNTDELKLTNLMYQSNESAFKEVKSTKKNAVINEAPVDEESTVSIKTTSAVKDKANVKKEELKEEPEAKNRWDIKLTEDEIELLAKIVWVESRGESSKGQRGVVEVVLNRMKHWAFKGSLEDVLSASGQFASWKLRNNAKPTKKEYKNIKKVLNGETDITSLNTVYFSTKSRNNKLLVHIGGHYFNEYEYETKEDRNKK